jgi:hypothetical protein
MVDYKPPYPIVRSSDMQPRDQIKLVLEEQLDPLTRAELSNLRAGIPYYFTVGDTPENRENFNFKAIYFQMVAYKEGWQFNPDNLQVVYIPPGDPRFPQDGYQSRILQFNDKSANKDVGLEHKISPESRLGFKVDERTDSVRQMEPKDADDLGAKVIRLFY